MRFCLQWDKETKAAIEEKQGITPLLLDILSNRKNNLEELSN
jgi:hypothetical protein